MTVLQILNSVQQMPRVKILQNAALLRSERALLVWGHTFEEVTQKLTSLEDQIADTMTSARLAKDSPAKTAVAAPTRGINYATPVCTYLALAGCTTIVMLEVTPSCLSCHFYSSICSRCTVQCCCCQYMPLQATPSVQAWTLAECCPGVSKHLLH